MTGYSKAPRGLSVQLRVVRVFTNTTTSPSPWSRQRSSRYTIRAGRNLPDKEFRYLRTVIVTELAQLETVRPPESFLLIACTYALLPVYHNITTSLVAQDTQVSQHIAGFINVTTAVQPIVTAAVHRGFSSGRRLAANPSL